jgi:UDP:flavonoid glycosyltransferase YjiC (YdhE family)
LRQESLRKRPAKQPSLDGLDASNLSALLDEVLNNPIYRDHSRSVQKAITKKNGLSVAADLLERAFGLNRTPVHEVASDA